MPKHFLEDMVQAKREKRGVSEIKQEIKQFRSHIESKATLDDGAIKVVHENISFNADYSKKRSRYMLWCVAFISIAFCLFAISFLFGKAEVTVNPKTKDIAVSENFSASKSLNGNGLLFDLVAIPGVENKTIQATGMKDVAQAATGVVVIYNAFSSAPQPLVMDTRLEGSNGKIYKTQAKIVVPGMSKPGTPGSVEVKIYGAQAGPDYNSPPLDFKIFGFKGTPKYAKFYGRSKGDITGGFKGKAPLVADADKISAQDKLKTALQAKLLQKAIDQIPSGFVLFKDAIFLNTDNANNEPNILSTYNKDNSLTLTMNGTLYGILFNEQDLTKKIANDYIDKYDGSDVYVPNIRDLKFTLTNKDTVSLGDVTNISFSLSGSAKIVWKLDANKLITDLQSKSKKDFNQILSQYPNVDSATLNLSPLWRMSIPDKAKDIKVIVHYPK